jgi:hypothetical protein
LTASRTLRTASLEFDINFLRDFYSWGAGSTCWHQHHDLPGAGSFGLHVMAHAGDVRCG